MHIRRWWWLGFVVWLRCVCVVRARTSIFRLTNVSVSWNYRTFDLFDNEMKCGRWRCRKRKLIASVSRIDIRVLNKYTKPYLDLLMTFFFYFAFCREMFLAIICRDEREISFAWKLFKTFLIIQLQIGDTPPSLLIFSHFIIIVVWWRDASCRFLEHRDC